ncbi:MAG: hypothetical protein OEL81_03840 [Nitrosopumilus sp.]|nr:hypothetical protein [Nitrosopumilus sp.]
MSKSCFVISPIGPTGSIIREKADDLLNNLIIPVLNELGYKVIRADKLDTPFPITKEIVKYVDESDLVIAVISDHNPNVFYELAVRNAIEKPIILLNKKDDKKSPFDLQDKRTIQYCEECMSTHLSEDNAKNLEDTKIQLKKQVENAEKHPKDASESMLSRYLQLPKRLSNCENEQTLLKNNHASEKKKITNRSILLILIITFVFIFSFFMIFLNWQNDYDDLQITYGTLLIGYEDMEKNYSQMLREKQQEIIEILIYREIQNLIDHSNVYTMMFTNGYQIGQASTQFSNAILQEYAQLSMFMPNVQTGDTLAYVYVMKPDPACEIILYAYLDTMKREKNEGRLLESCYMMRDNDLVLTSMYPTTGTQSFANALAKKIDLDPNTQGYDLIIASAIDWDRFSNNMQRAITLDDVRFVLVDSGDFVVADCDKNSCKNVKHQAQSTKEFSAMSVAKKYDSDEYSQYENHSKASFLNDNNLEVYGILNYVLLSDWKIYIHYN